MIDKTRKRRPGKRSKQVAEKTKASILMAALKIFAKEVFHNAKLREIAAEAGTSHNLIRHHFGSKDDLYKAVVDFGLEMRLKRLKEIINADRDMDPVELFKKTIASHILFVAEDGEMAKILLHSNSKTTPHFDYIMEKQEAIHKLIEPLFERVQQLGYFSNYDHDSFSIYMRAIAETPITTSDLSNKLLKHDILSEKGLALHTQRVIDFLFQKDKKR